MGLRVEILGELDHAARGLEPQVRRIQIPKTHAVERIHILEQPEERPHGLAAERGVVVGQAVHHYGQKHRRVVGLDAPGDQALLEVRGFVDAHDGVHAVHLVEAVVRAREVVQVDRAPEARGFLVHAGRLNQAKGVNHDAADVRLAVDPAGVREI